ncbi:hypothetical protein ACLOJK_027651 [Asimina triloba]
MDQPSQEVSSNPQVVAIIDQMTIGLACISCHVCLQKCGEAISSVESGSAKSLPPVADITERITKLPHGHSPLSRYHSNLSHSMFWRRARQRYGNQYSRRISTSNFDLLNSLHRSAASVYEERLAMKLNSHCNSESGYHEESRGRDFCRPERIRANALVIDSAASHVMKMVCRLCSKPLKQKVSHRLGNTMASGELSIVGVLACGHVYHADCLEERTPEGDRRDPPCPVCSDLVLKLNDFSGGS